MTVRRAVLALVLAFLSIASARGAVTTVDLVLTGRPVQADLHHPDGPPRAAAVLAHGFLRSRSTMAGHAAALARTGVLAVVPDLPYVTDSRENGRALVELIAKIREGAFAAPADRIVLIGFSAGGLSTLLAAASPGVVGYVGLDAFDRPGGVGLEAARKLQVPAVVIRGPASFCNAYGISAPWLTALPKLLAEHTIDGASHCDFESPTDRLCQFACGAADPARQQLVRDAILDAVEHFLERPAAASADSGAN